MRRKRLLTLRKRDSVGRTMACNTMLQTSILPRIRGGRRDSCMRHGHQSSCGVLSHGATHQILLLTEARCCQSADWAQHRVQLEPQGPATHWALFCLSEKHQLLAPGSYWDPNWTEPATQQEPAVALDIGIANVFLASSDIAPWEHVLHWFNPCTTPCSLRMVCFSSRESRIWPALCENLLSVNETFTLMRQLKWAYCEAYKNYWHS